jgi:outer membrane receptor for ferrienterochelin and colicin
MQGEQYLLLLKSKIRLHWNGIVSIYPQVINGMNSDVFLQSASTDLAIIHQSARKAGFEIRYHQINSRHHLVNKQSMKNNVQQKTVVANVWWRVCAPIHASFSYGQLLNGRNSMMDISWLADFGKRWKLSLAVQNLLNQSSYRLTVADDLGITTIDQHLNGRRILFSVRYIF